MKLEEIVANRYSGYICIEDILRNIADKYRCSWGDASLVLEEALSHTTSLLKPEPGLYEPGKLRPHIMTKQWFEVRGALRKKSIDASIRSVFQKYLCRRDEISRVLRDAGFPIDVTHISEDDSKVESNLPASHAGHISKHEARLADMERQLAEAKAEIERLTASSPLAFDGLMKIAIEVQHKHWKNYDPKTGSGREKQDVIVSMIRDKYGLSENQAKAVELVACPIPRNK